MLYHILPEQYPRGQYAEPMSGGPAHGVLRTHAPACIRGYCEGQTNGPTEAAGVYRDKVV